MPTQTLQISGMTCGSCVARVEAALKSVPSVTSCAVNLTTGLATVELTPHAHPIHGVGPPSDPTAALLAAVAHAGYSAIPIADGASAQTLRQISQDQSTHVASVRRRLLLGLLFGTPVLLLDMLPHSIIHSEFLSTLFATLVVFYTGRPFFTGALRTLRHGSANMDVLVALGSGTAYVYSLVLSILSLVPSPYSLVPHHSELHAAVTIIVLVTLGKYLEARAKRSANTAVAALASQSAATATRLDPDGTKTPIPVDAIAIGDTLEVLAHQTIPVDATLFTGSGSLDQSILTGESVPLELSAQCPVSSPQTGGYVAPVPTGNWTLDTGHSLPAGARLLDGRITIRATATAANSTIARILAMVQSAQASKTQIQALADRIAAIFVPIILALAALTFLGWLLLPSFFQNSEFRIQNFSSALIVTISVIVIACPCAMGLATPTALTVAIARAAKLGILFTNAAALETAGRSPRATVLFDKTGTLTQGRFSLIETVPLSPSPSSLSPGPSPLQLAASLEQFSTHPLARALTAAAQAQSLPLLDPDDFSSIPGGGLTGTINAYQYAIGSIPFLTSLGLDPTPAQREIARLHAAGLTLIALAQLPPAPPSPSPYPLAPSPSLLALFALRDTLRPDAAQTLAALRAAGHQVGVLSGDTQEAVLGTLVGISLDFVFAEVKPADKVATLKQIATMPGAISEITVNAPNMTERAKRSVFYVGDGINDAPALAAADLGIALASGTELAKAAGDVVLLSPHLLAVPQTLALARLTMRVIRQNLFWAFAYNVAAIPLAMAGYFPPGIAAGAMILSSLTVVFNALRLYRVKL